MLGYGTTVPKLLEILKTNIIYLCWVMGTENIPKILGILKTIPKILEFVNS